MAQSKNMNLINGLLIACIFGIIFWFWISRPPGYRAADAVEVSWTESYDDAVKQSKETGRPILANFTGSDWCHYCIQLDREVFTTPQFKEWAEENVVLLRVDFPRSVPQSENLIAQNKELNLKYQSDIPGFPTILFLDAEGRLLGKAGYLPGGPENWIATVTPIIEQN